MKDSISERVNVLPIEFYLIELKVTQEHDIFFALAVVPSGKTYVCNLFSFYVEAKQYDSNIVT